MAQTRCSTEHERNSVFSLFISRFSLEVIKAATFGIHHPRVYILYDSRDSITKKIKKYTYVNLEEWMCKTFKKRTGYIKSGYRVQTDLIRYSRKLENVVTRTVNECERPIYLSIYRV